MIWSVYFVAIFGFLVAHSLERGSTESALKPPSWVTIGVLGARLYFSSVLLLVSYESLKLYPEIQMVRPLPAMTSRSYRELNYMYRYCNTLLHGSTGGGRAIKSLALVNEMSSASHKNTLSVLFSPKTFE